MHADTNFRPSLLKFLIYSELISACKVLPLFLRIAHSTYAIGDCFKEDKVYFLLYLTFFEDIKIVSKLKVIKHHYRITTSLTKTFMLNAS